MYRFQNSQGGSTPANKRQKRAQRPIGRVLRKTKLRPHWSWGWSAIPDIEERPASKFQPPAGEARELTCVGVETTSLEGLEFRRRSFCGAGEADGMSGWRPRALSDVRHEQVLRPKTPAQDASGSTTVPGGQLGRICAWSAEGGTGGLGQRAVTDFSDSSIPSPPRRAGGNEVL